MRDKYIFDGREKTVPQIIMNNGSREGVTRGDKYLFGHVTATFVGATTTAEKQNTYAHDY